MRDDDQDFEQLDSFQDFLQELGDVKPIKSDDKVHLQQTQQAIETSAPGSSAGPETQRKSINL